MWWSEVKQSAAGLLGGAGDRHALLAWSRRGVLAAGAVLTLGACGFKLRQAPNFAFRTIYINAGAAASLANELRRSIATSDKVQVLVDSREMAGADVVLELLSSLQEKVVVAQNGSIQPAHAGGKVVDRGRGAAATARRQLQRKRRPGQGGGGVIVVSQHAV